MKPPSPQLLKFWRYPLWLRIPVFLLLAGFIALLGFILHYQGKASRYDLAELEGVPQGALVLDREGREFGRIYTNGILPIAYDDIPRVLIDAVIATEDSRFMRHSGMDLIGIARSAVVNFKAGEIVQGGSTITQQLARNIYDLKEKSYDRKFTEILLARRIESVCTKEEIIRYYLNRIYFGSGYYGIGAAARGYFGKDVQDIDLAEAALLAGIIKSPNNYSPFRSPDKAKTVRRMTLGRMVALDMISRQQADEAQDAEIITTREAVVTRQPRHTLRAIEKELAKAGYDRKKAEEGVLQTALDSDLQRTLQDSIDDHLTSLEETINSLPELRAAAIVINHESGDILASVGGRDFRTDSFDRALLAKRPAGSAFLPFTYAAFFEENPDAIYKGVVDAPLDNEKVMIGGRKGTLAEWGRDNESFLGLVSPAVTLIENRMGASVRVGNYVGVKAVNHLAEACGIESELRPFPSTYLGSSSITLAELARAFGSFANEGRRVPQPGFLHQFVDGNKFTRLTLSHFRPLSFSRMSMGRDTAQMMRHLMSTRLQQSHYRSVIDSLGLDATQLIGQGGISYNEEDAWFVGSNPEFTCAVWVGADNERSLRFENPDLTLAFPIWAKVMQSLALQTEDEWRTPGGEMICLHGMAMTSDSCLGDPDALLIAQDALPESDSRAIAFACEHHNPGVEQPSQPVPVRSAESREDFPVVTAKSPHVITDPID